MFWGVFFGTFERYQQEEHSTIERGGRGGNKSYLHKNLSHLVNKTEIKYLGCGSFFSIVSQRQLIYSWYQPKEEQKSMKVLSRVNPKS